MESHVTTWCFFRHGEVDNPTGINYGRTIDVPLLDEKRHLIRQCGALLAEHNLQIDHFYSSRLLRAVQTTKELLSIFPQAQMIVDERLIDTNSRGLAGRPMEEIMNIPDLYRPGPNASYWVEEPSSMIERVLSVIYEAERAMRGKTVGIVSHGDPLAFALYHLQHPDRDIPDFQTLLQSHIYPKKAECWVAVSDGLGNFSQWRKATNSSQGFVFLAQ